MTRLRVAVCAFLLSVSIAAMLICSMFLSIMSIAHAIDFAPSVKAEANATTTDWWPTFGHDTRNTRFSLSSAPHAPSLQWEFRLWVGDSSPVVADGRVFIGSSGSDAKGIYSLNETDGTLLWSYSTTNIVTSSPAVASGMVFIGSEDGKVYSFNATNGALIWSYATGESIHLSSPAVADRMVFIGSNDDKVYALNETTGELIWTYTTGGDVWSSPAVADGMVFIGSWDTKVYALDESTGALIWSYTTDLRRSSPAVVNGRVFICSSGGLYCLNETDGTQIWKSQQGMDGGSPAVANGRVFTTTNIGADIGYIYSFNETTGAQIWNYTGFSTLHSFYSSPTVADGLVFINAPYWAGPMAFDETTGVRVWKYLGYHQDWGNALSSPAVANGKVFLVGIGVAGYVGVFSFGSPHSLTIDPTFNDNAGSTLNPLPSSWSIRLPNGTMVTISSSSVTYLQSQPGRYSIASIVWQGSEVVPETPLSIFVVSDTEWTPIIDCRVYSLTVTPTFYDNTGTTLVQPSSWSIRFPNGTTITASSPASYSKTQAGDYSIVNIMWKGAEVFPDTTPTTSLTSNMLWSPNINLLLPTGISMTLSSSTSYIGFKVKIKGNLTCNEIGLLGTPILLSYSVTSGETWNDITLTNTISTGAFSAVWIPSATGNYLVRATWFGNSTYPETTTMVNLAVIPFEERNVFSVTSDSTVSELAFNSTSRELSFTATGPSGTTGYANVYIAKTLIDNISDVKVYLDGEQLNYMVTSEDDSWLLHFTYIHSTHKIAIDLGLAPFIPPQLITPLSLGILALALAVATALIISKIRKGTPPTILDGVFRERKQAPIAT